MKCYCGFEPKSKLDLAIHMVQVHHSPFLEGDPVLIKMSLDAAQKFGDVISLEAFKSAGLI